MDEPIDRLIAEAARPHGGYIKRIRLLRLGLTARQISYRVRCGRLHAEYRGVYAVGHRPVLPVDRAHGALLAAGPDAALSHRSAAALWELITAWVFPFEVTTPRNRQVSGIVIHRSQTLRPRDITVQLGVRTTTMPRTIFDLAPRLDDRELKRMIDQALHTPFLRIEQLHDLISRLPQTPTARRLTQLLKPGYRPTRSELERLYQRWCREENVPVGIINAPLQNGREVDVHYPEHNLILELDSVEFHTDRTTFHRDRRKDREQLANGTATVRLTWEALHLDPHGEADLFTAILDQRSGRWG